MNSSKFIRWQTCFGGGYLFQAYKWKHAGNQKRLECMYSPITLIQVTYDYFVRTLSYFNISIISKMVLLGYIVGRKCLSINRYLLEVGILTTDKKFTYNVVIAFRTCYICKVLSMWLMSLDTDLTSQCLGSCTIGITKHITCQDCNTSLWVFSSWQHPDECFCQSYPSF